MKIYVIGYGLLISCVILFWVGASYMEMRTFNKFSESKQATLVDAMFAELRILD